MNENETWVRGIALALRDLCEQNGGVTASITFEGGSVMTYTVERGAVLLAAGHRLDIPETALDHTGLVPAEAQK